MVKIIMGLKGSGKTKQIIELAKKAVESELGDVVFIERAMTLTYDLPYTIRLVEAPQNGFSSYEFLKGFISGLHAANYDISDIFIDNLFKVINVQFDAQVEEFLDWCESFSEREKIKITMTISADSALASEGMRKYM